MKLSTRVKPISYLKRHAAEIVKDISERREPMLITRNGEAKLVVMDVKSYEEHEETLALLKLLALGNREIEQGHFRPVEEETRSHRFVPFRLRAGFPTKSCISCAIRAGI
ncbi:type II toxin-antitoxin system Phd/YefM family antitoxin [Burkholderia sp. AU32262]|uniref:type II toxin-antitoxin system Phd/YefM family antitoxin n=1 Tax=Burkholderia sp. AU32262 TaxID=2879630 RepID=UPI001CF2DAF0|nr:type II toxin-antitoxin system Phd/YefM family antitoxin [Burkholderia sp. AU32262]MCA8239489.1 type II toxin-antitoxin system Phd/YefM family antitoxin [Burkholderia sp. AU32262]